MAGHLYTSHAQTNDSSRTSITMTCALQPLGVWRVEHRRDAHTLILCRAEVQPPPRALVKRRADCIGQAPALTTCNATHLHAVLTTCK